MKFSAFNSKQVGMTACWAGPTNGNEGTAGFASTPKARDAIVRLVYADSATRFRELSYTPDNPQVYTLEQTLPDLDGHATPACYNWDEGTVDYLMFVDLKNAVNVYWFVPLGRKGVKEFELTSGCRRDTNSSLTSTKDHPINTWTKCMLVPKHRATVTP